MKKSDAKIRPNIKAKVKAVDKAHAALSRAVSDLWAALRDAGLLPSDSIMYVKLPKGCKADLPVIDAKELGEMPE